MTLLDSPLERRLSGIEHSLDTIKTDLSAVKTDVAVVKAKLEAVPSRWLQGIFAISILLPIYGILVTLFVALVLK